jgi:hypothetical protein
MLQALKVEGKNKRTVYSIHLSAILYFIVYVVVFHVLC